MQRDAAPGKSLHVRHRRTVIDRRPMLLLLLQDCEYPSRRRVTWAAGAYGGGPDQNTIAIDIGSLLSDAHDHDHGTGGYGFGHPQKLAFLELIDGRVDGQGGFCAPKRY